MKNCLLTQKLIKEEKMAERPFFLAIFPRKEVKIDERNDF